MVRIAPPNSAFPADVNGKLSELSRTVGQETETAAGEKSKTVDTYSSQLPGSAGNGTLQLNRRVTTIQKKDATGEQTEQQVEEPNLGNPSDGLQARAKTKYVVQYAAAGTQHAAGNFADVVEIRGAAAGSRRWTTGSRRRNRPAADGPSAAFPDFPSGD